MGMPFYVAPEQIMKDRADYARKGIARGRSLIAAKCADGILLCAENPSSTLRKISEIYDRIAFAGVGRYNEFDQLRVAGVRHADLKGYSYSREDVDARSLANAYAQALGQVFTHEMKPLEVEILVAEVGAVAAGDQLFHILYDGTVIDEPHRAVLGGDAEAIGDRFEAAHSPDAPIVEALAAAIAALGGPDRTLAATDVEAAVLGRDGTRRAFRRLTDDEIAAAAGASGAASPASGDDATEGTDATGDQPRPADQVAPAAIGPAAAGVPTSDTEGTPTASPPPDPDEGDGDGDAPA